jgi:hypothetical protein
MRVAFGQRESGAVHRLLGRRRLSESDSRPRLRTGVLPPLETVREHSVRAAPAV